LVWLTVQFRTPDGFAKEERYNRRDGQRHGHVARSSAGSIF
jgi:hypothetical protein